MNSFLHSAQTRPQSVAGKLLRLPFKLVPKRAVMRIRSGAARGMRWRVEHGIHGCWLGTYESDKQESLRPYLKKGMSIFDVGANTGFYTLLFSRAVGREGKICAFEPLAQNVAALLEHLNLNRIHNVSVVQSAVGPDTDFVGFTISSNSYQNKIAGRKEAMLLVSQIGLDGFIASGAASPPDLMKIDVEGAEASVLEGARETLRNHRPIIFLALHSEEQQERCAAILRECDYKLYDMDSKLLPEGKLEIDEIIALPNSTEGAVTS